MTPISDDLTERRLEVVRRHMASENDHDFDTTMGTFAHPRYELIPTGQVFDGEDQPRRQRRLTSTATAQPAAATSNS